MDAAKNFAKGTLSTGIDDTETTIELIAGDGERFPAAPFNAVVWNATDYSDPADDPSREIVRVTAKSTDTLTVTRGQEGTSGITHNTAGKVYRLLAGLTAKVINQDLPAITRTGDNFDIFSAGEVKVSAEGTRVLDLAPGDTIDCEIGDLDNLDTGTKLSVMNSLGQISLTGKIGTDQSASATTLGTVTKKLEIFDNAGNSLGFIPIYNSIT